MKYIKAEAPFALEDGKKTLVQTYHHKAKEGMRDNAYTNALMVNANISDKMVLVSDAKCLLPYPSRGAILDRSHNINLAELEELAIHPETWDKLVAQGVLDKNGNVLQGKSVKAVEEEDVPTAPAPVEEAPAPEAAEVPEEAPRTEDADPATANPLDVNNDGVVDSLDTAAVAEAAAAGDAIDKLTLPQLKKRYKEVFGKAAPKNWKADTLVKKIKESL